jgi:acetyl esterase/lipase
MKKHFILSIIFILHFSFVFSQDLISLWPKGKMPNSKGIKLERIEERQRVTQIDIPGMYAFFPSKEENTGAAVLIFPPGGYQKLTYNLAGIQLAKWFNTFGVSAFVVMYRLPTSPDLQNAAFGPVMDGQRAIKVVRNRAEEWGIDKNRIGVMGCSAGGGLAVNLATFSKDFSQINDELDTVNYKPNFQIIVSGAISMIKNAHQGSHDALLGKNASHENETLFSGELNVTQETPPAFVICATNDPVINPLNSLQYYEALLQAKVQSALHIFPQGGHSIALRNNPGSTELWTRLCETWMKEIGVLKN